LFEFGFFELALVFFLVAVLAFVIASLGLGLAVKALKRVFIFLIMRRKRLSRLRFEPHQSARD
jgi:hypothetical protein